MKFSVLVAIIPDEMEEKTREEAEKAGAGGVTIISGRGSGLEKKSFFGLSIEGQQTVLLYVIEKRLAVKVLKAIKSHIELSKHGMGLAFTLPIEHLAGIGLKEIEKFSEEIKEDV